LDNLIIIWDPAKGHKVYTLEGHTSFVKGVAWDPIGKYLASQSDDRTAKVRRQSGQQPESSVIVEQCSQVVACRSLLVDLAKKQQDQAMQL